MKWLMICACLVLASCKNVPSNSSSSSSSSSEEDSDSRIVNLIKNNGYNVNTYTVTTKDGYILDIFRITSGQVENEQSQDQQRPVVLLMHGMMSSAEDFLYGGQTQGLAYYLADKGYDVFLGNARGSLYGHRHTTLDPTKDTSFWRFCWHEIGVNDLPAIIDKVLSVSQQEHISYIGHMEGATAFYVLASERPEYNAKIQRMVSLGPIAFLQKSTHPILEQIATNYKSRSWVIRNMGMSTFRPSTDLYHDLETQCEGQSHATAEFCRNIYFLFNGYNSANFNQTTVKVALPRVPSGGSINEVLHFAQLKNTGRFETFNMPYDQQRVEEREYDLSKITVPVAIFYTPNDHLSHVDDVQTLIKRLPNVNKQHIWDQLSNNLDILYANNVAEIYSDITNVLQQKGEIH